MTAESLLTVEAVEARLAQLTQALFHVASELWATRDRQIMLERVLADNGLDAPALVDRYRPDDILAARLTAEREAFIASIVGYLAPDA